MSLRRERPPAGKRAAPRRHELRLRATGCPYRADRGRGVVWRARLASYSKALFGSAYEALDVARQDSVRFFVGLADEEDSDVAAATVARVGGPTRPLSSQGVCRRNVLAGFFGRLLAGREAPATQSLLQALGFGGAGDAGAGR